MVHKSLSTADLSLQPGENLRLPKQCQPQGQAAKARDAGLPPSPPKQVEGTAHSGTGAQGHHSRMSGWTPGAREPTFSLGTGEGRPSALPSESAPALGTEGLSGSIQGGQEGRTPCPELQSVQTEEKDARWGN